jgi:hypothetical protein
MTKIQRLTATAALTSLFQLAAPLQGQDHKARQDRPIPMGVSIGNTPSLPFIYAGTAGMLVRSFSNPNLRFILSNNHVLGAKGPGLCPNSATVGTWTLQPGTLDIHSDPGPNPFYIAGSIAGVRPITSSPNLIDAALAITTTSLAKSEILGIGQPNVALGIATPGMQVTKSGRTTGVTTGTVEAVNVAVEVDYGTGCGTFPFIGQTIISPGLFSDAGDSGSAILDSATHTPVGLLFAGNDTSTVANQIFWAYVLLGVFPDGAGTLSATSVQQLQGLRARQEAATDARIARVSEIQTRHQSRILGIPGIRAVGVGLDGTDMVLKVYGASMTPEISRALPRQIEGTRVVFRAGSAFKAR